MKNSGLLSNQRTRFLALGTSLIKREDECRAPAIILDATSGQKRQKKIVLLFTRIGLRSLNFRLSISQVQWSRIGSRGTLRRGPTESEFAAGKVGRVEIGLCWKAELRREERVAAPDDVRGYAKSRVEWSRKETQTLARLVSCKYQLRWREDERERERVAAGSAANGE